MEEKVLIRSNTLVDVYHQVGLEMEVEKLEFRDTERRGGQGCFLRRYGTRYVN